uniref:Actin, cytoplasmic 1 n=1 Tax=Xenopus tropicalis TaxID=8364 RepID=A0A5S6K4Q5_XENTR
QRDKYSRPFRSRKREAFEDILEARRQTSDLTYAMRRYTPVIYRHLTPCPPSALKTMVLQSVELQYVIGQISLEIGQPLDSLQKQAADILDEMGQNLRMEAVRFFALTLSKIFKRLFRKVRVNEEGVQRLTQAIREHPVVLIPNHQSYVDFLMLSFVLYTYDLALPVIAAGIALTGMTLVGELLRMAGAFYIKRGFRGNPLYWAVFAEYVKALVRSGYAPVEFFIEGWRSRTGKILSPKFGMLTVVMEPFFKGQVFDTYIVPISITYERVLEESLLAYELLGVPKPKESTSGMIKARSVLHQNFGSIHVYFGVPLSLRSLSYGRISRSQYNLTPRHLPQQPSEDLHLFVRDVAYKVELTQIANMVLSPGVLVATILLQNLPEMDFNVLVEKTLWLKDLVEAFGGFLEWPDNESAGVVVRSSIELHSNLLRLVDGRVALFEELTGSMTEEVVFRRAVSTLTCALYRNQVINVCVRPALVVLAREIVQSSRKEDILNSFHFLRDIFSKEFIFSPSSGDKDFEEGCSMLAKCDIIHVTPNEIKITDSGAIAALFLSQMFQPFLEGYKLAASYLSREVTNGFTEMQYVSGMRSFISRLIVSGASRCVEALSSDMQKNTLSSFVQLGVITKLKSTNETTFYVEKRPLEEMAEKLGLQLSMEKIPSARL